VYNEKDPRLLLLRCATTLRSLFSLFGWRFVVVVAVALAVALDDKIITINEIANRFLHVHPISSYPPFGIKRLDISLDQQRKAIKK
jgi:hypothetical protein